MSSSSSQAFSFPLKGQTKTDVYLREIKIFHSYASKGWHNLSSIQNAVNRLYLLNHCAIYGTSEHHSRPGLTPLCLRHPSGPNAQPGYWEHRICPLTSGSSSRVSAFKAGLYLRYSWTESQINPQWDAQLSMFTLNVWNKTLFFIACLG